MGATAGHVEWLCEHCGIVRLGGAVGEPFFWAATFKRLPCGAVVVKGALKGLKRDQRRDFASVLRLAGIDEFRFERRRGGPPRVFVANTSGGAARFVPLDDVEAEMNDETKQFAKKHRDDAGKAVAAASGEREKVKALARANNAMLVSGLELRKAAAIAEYDEAIALTQAQLPEALAALDAIFDGK
jgi:hypothetical protein